MEDVIIIDVTDVTHSFADHFGVVELGARGDFATHHDQIAFHEGFARHSASAVARQAGVENVIRDGVANLVRMAFTDRFR